MGTSKATSVAVAACAWEIQGPDRLAAHRSTLSDTVGANVQLITNVIPEVTELDVFPFDNATTNRLIADTLRCAPDLVGGGTMASVAKASMLGLAVVIGAP
jgi:hypothetical protein